MAKIKTTRKSSADKTKKVAAKKKAAKKPKKAAVSKSENVPLLTLEERRQVPFGSIWLPKEEEDRYQRAFEASFQERDFDASPYVRILLEVFRVRGEHKPGDTLSLERWRPVTKTDWETGKESEGRDEGGVGVWELICYSKTPISGFKGGEEPSMKYLLSKSSQTVHIARAEYLHYLEAFAQECFADMNRGYYIDPSIASSTQKIVPTNEWEWQTLLDIMKNRDPKYDEHTSLLLLCAGSLDWAAISPTIGQPIVSQATAEKATPDNPSVPTIDGKPLTKKEHEVLTLLTPPGRPHYIMTAEDCCFELAPDDESIGNSTFFRRTKRLKDAGLIKNVDGIGYYRPDHLPKHPDLYREISGSQSGDEVE